MINRHVVLVKELRWTRVTQLLLLVFVAAPDGLDLLAGCGTDEGVDALSDGAADELGFGAGVDGA